MIWNIFISLLPLPVMIWLWTDATVKDFLEVEFLVVASFILALTTIVGLVHSIFGEQS